MIKLFKATDLLKIIGLTVVVLSSAFLSPISAEAAVTVTAATGGTNISADNAANAIVPAWTTLGNIIIASNNNNDIAKNQSNVTLILTVPSGWNFNAGVGSGSVSGSEITFDSISVTSSTITFAFTRSSRNSSNATITISGIQVRSTDGSVLPNSGNILRTSANPGTATIIGITEDVTNFGSLSQVVGAKNKLSFTTQPSSSATINTDFTTKPIVTLQDQFGTTISSDNTSTITRTAVLSTQICGGTAGSGILSSTPANGAAVTAGVMTYTAMQYSFGESIKICASSIGVTSALSNTITVNNPVPTTTSISPTSKTVGDAEFTITVNGTNFISSSVVRFGGVDIATTFINSTQVTAIVPASEIATAGNYNVRVFNPTPGGGLSNAQLFTVNNPVPTTTSISPTSATEGDPGFVITVNGTNFISSSVVRFGGVDMATTFINSTQVTAIVPASEIATAGNYNVRVFNPTPGGGLSNAQLFTVNAFQNPVPTTTSISPTSKTAGDAEFTMTVNGTNFISSSVVKFAGTSKATTYVSASQLTAVIPASDLTTAGTFDITVFNPTPGGGTSNAQTFTVNAVPTNPIPTTTSISPTSVTVGGTEFELTVNGTNFITNSVVQFNASNRVTTFVSSTQLTATITASDISSIGAFDIGVFNPTPGGGTSNTQVLSVVAAPDNTAPVVTAFSIPATSSSVFVPITTFTVTDNIGVAGYLITESSSAPLANDQNWSVNVPTTFNVVTQGDKTLYAWAKDAAGNISTSLSASVTVTFVDVSFDQIQTLVSAGTIVPIGSINSTDQITFNQEVHIDFTGDTTIVVPFNTNMNTGTSVDFSQLTGTTTVSTGDLSADYIAVGAVSFGLPSTSLTTSQAVTISIATDTAYNSQSMDVFKKEVGESAWTQTTTCTVNNGVCSFTSSSFSSFVLGKPILAPAAISNLAASNPTTSSATLTWTAPGNIGNNGTAMLYDLRYSNSNITSANFSAATQVSGMPAPLVAGTQQSKTVSGLSENTTYYFAIKTSNAIGFTSGISNIAQITLGAVSIGTLQFNIPTSVIFSGWAYPGGIIKVYRRSLIDNVITNNYLPDFDVAISETGQFAKQFIGLFESAYLFALEPFDRDGRSGGIITFTTTLTAQNRLILENIFMPPTINLDSAIITKGKDIVISGYATPGSSLEIRVDNVLDYKATAGSDGRYKFSLNTQRFGIKDHFITARQVSADGNKSDYSSMKNFAVSLLAYPRSDLNGDGLINVGDWSMFLSRWNSTSGDLKTSLDMNGDDKVDVADLSIFFKALKGE